MPARREVWTHPRRGTGLVIQCSPYMALSADECRQRAADAKHRALQANEEAIRSRLEQLAADWIALAERMERIGRQKSPPPCPERK